LNELIVKVGADITDFLTKMKKLENDLQDVSDSFQAIGENMTTFVTLPMVAAGAASVKLASDMGETLNKVNVAFGDSAKEVLKWSETSVEQMGLAAGTALDAAALFGDMGTSMGFAKDDAAGMAMSLTQLGADLASFKNIPIEQAMQALNGVFTGETESLKMLGVVMTQTQLQAFALTQGITKKVEKMTEAEAVALRYAFVMDRTKNAQGDFARTSEGSANQMRMFMESLKELGVQFGNIILPTFTEFITKINEVLKGMMDLSPEVKKAIIVFGAIAAVVGPLLLVLSAMIPVIINLTTAAGAMISALQFLTAASTWTAAVNGLNAALASLRVTMLAVAANPITALIAAFAAVVYAGVQMYENWDKISNKLKFLAVTVGGVAGQLATLGAFLAKNWDGVQLAFEMIVEKIKNNFRYLLFGVNPIIAMLVNVGIELAKKWDTISNAIAIVFDKMKNAIRIAILFAVPFIGLLVNAGIELVKNWDTVKNSIKFVFESIKKYAQDNFEPVIKVIEAVGGVFSDVFNWIRQNVPFVNEAINSMKQTFSDFSTELERRRQVKALEELHEQTQKNVWISDYMNKKNVETTRTTYDANTAMQDLLASINGQTNALTNNNKAKDEATKKAKELADAQQKLIDASLKTTNALGDAIITALKNRYAQEEQVQKDSLAKQQDRAKSNFDTFVSDAKTANQKVQDSFREMADRNIEQIRRTYDEQIGLIDSSTKEQLNILNAQVDAINRQTEEEEKAIREKEFQKQKAEKIRSLSTAKSEEERIDILDQLQAMDAKREREMLLEKRKVLIDDLRQRQEWIRLDAERQRKDKEEQMKREIAIEQERLANDLQSLQTNFENKIKTREQFRASEEQYFKNIEQGVRDHYAELNKEDKLQAQARELFLDTNNQNVIKLLASYNPKWQEAGKTWAEKLLTGIQSAGITEAIDSIMSKITVIQSAKGNIDNPSPSFAGIGGRVDPFTNNAIMNQLGSQNLNVYLDGKSVAAGVAPHIIDATRKAVNTIR
jgi:hypothetical protein